MLRTVYQNRIAFTLIFVAFFTSAACRSQQPEEPTEIKVELSKPDVEDGLVRGTRQTFTVVVKNLGTKPEPNRIYLDFYRGKVSSGQFAVSKPKFQKRPDGAIETQVEGIVPSKPGEYQIKLKIHWGRPEATDPTSTVDVKVE